MKHLLSLLDRVNGDPDRLPSSVSVKTMVGDASSRRYYRLTDHIGSAVLMRLPEGAPPIEEGFTGGKTRPNPKYPFLSIQELLFERKIPVVDIYGHNLNARYILLEDLGDTQLFHWFRENSSADLTYEKLKAAVDLLISIQLRCDVPFKQSEQPCFDSALFLWEFDHFIEYGLGFLPTTAMNRTEKSGSLCALRELFMKLSSDLASLPKVFTHRDYHCKNIMLKDAQMILIDFQDALLGPATYDLASLVRDSYHLLSKDTVGKLVDYYRENSPIPFYKEMDSGEFKRVLHLTALQRNLKAWGRFLFIARVKGNPSYLPFIPTTIAQIKRFAEYYPEIDRLLEELSKDYARR